MKTRNGFVSNSSSSSFVVAFPNRPKDAADVWKFMFDGKDGGLSCFDQEGLSYSQVSTNVFDSIEHSKFKKATIKAIAEEFSDRYYYHPERNVFWDGRLNDVDGGAWSYPLDRYFGSDMKIMNELKKYTIEFANKEKELNEREKTIISKSGIKPPKWAYKGGIDSNTQKPYTDKEVAAQEKYCNDMDNYRKTNPEYIDLQESRREAWNNKHKKIEELTRLIAKKDAQNFFKDNKGKFIFVVSYSDNDGTVGCTMEHGDIFRNVPHVKISHH